MLGISSGAQRLLRCHCERDGGGVVSSSQRAKPRNKKVPSTGSDRHESRIRSLQNEIPQEPVCGQAQEACLHAPLRGRGGLLQGHGQRRRRSVPKPDQFVLAGLCHEASQGADYLAEQQGLTLRSSRELRRSEEHTSELQSLMRTSYAVFCLKKKKEKPNKKNTNQKPNTHSQI